MQNRELDADFNLSHFDHVAFYDADRERVEMHLRANRNVMVELGGLGMKVALQKGEMIHTEICGKFSRESAGIMAEEPGLRIERWHSDPESCFSLWNWPDKRKGRSLFATEEQRRRKVMRDRVSRGDFFRGVGLGTVGLGFGVSLLCSIYQYAEAAAEG